MVETLNDALEEWSSSKEQIFPASKSDIKGMEFEWFSVDKNGFLAVFSAAGFGKVPDVVFQKKSDHILLESYLTRTHFGRSEVTASKHSRNIYLKTLAARGLRAYEWSQHVGSYELIFEPRNPLTIRDIDKHVAEAVANVGLSTEHWSGRVDL